MDGMEIGMKANILSSFLANIHTYGIYLYQTHISEMPNTLLLLSLLHLLPKSIRIALEIGSRRKSLLFLLSLLVQ
jgi:hypothetical protein